MLPLTPAGRPDAAGGMPTGAVFRFERRGPAFAARWLSPVWILPCVGRLRDEAEAERLGRALAKGGQEFVRSLHRHSRIAIERCWLWAEGWCLSYDEVASPDPQP